MTRFGMMDLNRDTLEVAMSDALMLRAGLVLYEADAYTGRLVRGGDGRPRTRAPHARSRDFQGLRLSEMCRAWLGAIGVPAVGTLSVQEVVGLALNARRLEREYGALSQGVGDFANVLGDTVGRTLRASYTEQPASWRRWARQATAPDLRSVTRASISEAGSLVKRGLGGGVVYSALGDGGETYALAEYIGGLRIGKAAIINDNLDFMGRLPQLEASAAIRTEEDVAYFPLTDNTALADTYALCGSEHANVQGSGSEPWWLLASPSQIDTIEVCFLEGMEAPQTTEKTDFDTDDLLIKVSHFVAAKAIDYRGIVKDAGTALSVSSLGTAKALMRKQLGPKGDARLNLAPTFLLVGTDNETTAGQLLASVQDPAKYNDAANPFGPGMEGRLQLIVNPRLDV